METKQITLRSQTVQCPHCGEYYSVTYKYCPFCDVGRQEEERRMAERQLAQDPTQKATEAPKSGKEQYLKSKQAAADARKKKALADRLTKECAALEEELATLEEELFGSAAADYVRAAELDARKNTVEERLMEIYEELENLSEEEPTA